MPPKRVNAKGSSESECSVLDNQPTDSNEGEDPVQMLKETLCVLEGEKAALLQALEDNRTQNEAQVEHIRSVFERNLNGKDDVIAEMRDEISHLRENVDLRDEELRRLQVDRVRKYDVPPPQQILYDGNSSYVSFMRQFGNLAQACKWDDREKAFRLLSSLRGAAADFVFQQVSLDKQRSFRQLESALEARFQERRSTASFLAELEGQKLQSREKIVEYVADIKRLVGNGYPTADEVTLNTISLRYFLKGLGDSHMALTIGMKDPKTIDEARDLLETYFSLKDETKQPKVRMVHKPDAPITESQFIKFKKEITDSIDAKFDEILKLLKPKDGEKENKKWRPDKFTKTRDLSWVECYKCHDFGHYARSCPNGDKNDSLQEN